MSNIAIFFYISTWRTMSQSYFFTRNFSLLTLQRCRYKNTPDVLSNKITIKKIFKSRSSWNLSDTMSINKVLEYAFPVAGLRSERLNRSCAGIAASNTSFLHGTSHADIQTRPNHTYNEVLALFIVRLPATWYNELSRHHQLGDIYIYIYLNT